MKKTALTLFVLIIPFLANAGEGYEKAMTEAIEKMYSASEVSEYIEAVNQFDRISNAEVNEWLPSYYAAFCYTMIAGKKGEQPRTDQYLDKANIQLDNALIRKGDEAEILTLKGLVAMMRISVDPAVRGQEYAMKAAGFLQQASQVDANNPRTLLMLGQLQYGTAQFFSAGTTEACNTFRKAIELFDSEAKTEKSIAPAWGKQQATSMLKNCEG